MLTVLSHLLRYFSLTFFPIYAETIKRINSSTRTGPTATHIRTETHTHSGKVHLLMHIFPARAQLFRRPRPRPRPTQRSKAKQSRDKASSPSPVPVPLSLASRVNRVQRSVCSLGTLSLHTPASLCPPLPWPDTVEDSMPTHVACNFDFNRIKMFCLYV